MPQSLSLFCFSDSDPISLKRHALDSLVSSLGTWCYYWRYDDWSPQPPSGPAGTPSPAGCPTLRLVWNPSERKRLENKESFRVGEKRRERFSGWDWKGGAWGRKEAPSLLPDLFPETPRNERSRALLTRLLFAAGGVLASQHCLPSVADSLLHPPPSPGWRARRDCQAGRQSGCTVGMPVPSLPPSRSSNVTAAPAAAARILGWDCAASLH